MGTQDDQGCHRFGGFNVRFDLSGLLHHSLKRLPILLFILDMKKGVLDIFLRTHKSVAPEPLTSGATTLKSAPPPLESGDCTLQLVNTPMETSLGAHLSIASDQGDELK